MRRLVIAVVLVSGCAEESSGGESSSSESGGIDPSEGDTFSESSSSGDAPEYPDGEMFGRCDANVDCVGFDQSVWPTTLCRASTCVAPATPPTMEPDGTPIGGWSCPAESAPVATAWQVGQDPSAYCGLRARIEDGLGHCPGGMTVAVFRNAYDDSFSSVTCWWSPSVVSGTTCLTDGECEGCEPQPSGASGLPNVCL